MWKPKGNNFGRLYDVNSNGSIIYRSGEVSKDTLKKFHSQLNIEYMINLRDDLSQEEEKEIMKSGITLAHYPMSDSKAPEGKVIDNIKMILFKMDKSLINLIVCCAGGRHRTGLISAIYLVLFKNYTKKEAWKINVEKYNWYDKAFLGFGKDHSALRKWFFEYELESLRIKINERVEHNSTTTE